MIFMNLLSRYVSRTFLLSFLTTFSCLFIIIFLFDFAELQRRAGTKEIDLLMKLNMVLLRSPQFLEQVLPFIVLIAALFVFWRMNRSNELVVIRSSGVSLWRIILPVSMVALIIGFVDLAVFNPLSSAMQVRFEKLEKRYLLRNKEDIKLSPTGLWFSEKRGPHQVIYRASKVNLEKMEFQDLNIIITSEKNKFIERLDAKTGQIHEGHLDLNDGWDLNVGQVAKPFVEKSISTSLNRKKIEQMQNSRLVSSFWKLPAYIALLDAAGLQSLKYQMSWQSMLANSFWLGFMVLLAAAFSCRPVRQGKSALFIFLGLFSGLFLYFFKDMTFAIGASGGLPPIIAAWLPPLITVMVGAVIVFSQEDG
ncbi:MAG: LptF/LptG family permease [Alphaproteobacteria bacterium]|nr:LptF/LptG family permease [Alphaproteobacteria bacterium]